MPIDGPQYELALVPHTYQGQLIQQRASDGYINATAMCKAAGKSWADYRRNGATSAFLDALSADMGIPISELVQSIKGGPPQAQGTFVNPQVAIHLAQWLSPQFAVKVSQWVYDWMTGADPTERVWQQFEDRVSLVYDSVPEGYFCVFREIADIFATMISRGVDFGTRMLLDISVGRHWSMHWSEADLEAEFGEKKYFDHCYPNYFRQAQSNPQPASCYPEDALPTFRRWMRDVYIPKKMPPYLKSQVKQGKLAPEIANDTIALLEESRKARALPRPQR